MKTSIIIENKKVIVKNESIALQINQIVDNRFYIHRITENYIEYIEVFDENEFEKCLKFAKKFIKEQTEELKHKK